MRTGKPYRVVVLDDSRFFNTVLTRHLKNYTEELEKDHNCSIDVYSFTSVEDCMRNLQKDTDVAFVDYFLGNRVTAPEVIRKIKEICDHCRVVVMSHVHHVNTIRKVIREGALEFLHKDKDGLQKSCFIIEDIIKGNC
jgi:DNA-binding NtrC family response regulator